MASVKRRGGKRAPPPPPPRKMSRLARIKLEGGAQWAQMAEARKRRKPGTTLAGALLIGGAAIAGAAWIGGSLFDAREAVYAGADGLATAAGLRATIEVRGVDGQRKREVEAAALPEGRVSIMAASPDRVKDNVESLDWVDQATVERLWPSTIRITVARRDAFAIWQENGAFSVVDAAGERVHGARPSDHVHLPRIVGRGAGSSAEPVLRAVEDLPGVRARLTAFVRVGDRRWNMNMRNGMVVLLPAHDPVAALHRLERLHQAHRLLDQPYARLDLRVEGQLVAQARQVFSAAPARLAAPAAAPRGA
ncbi:MAG: cell division protein FtsQ/DivIB [Hyphomonadaceae bacterium]|nr:cell division protein FtsQ/DivIB [Hyphomonadaceae bacterium]